MKLKCPVAGTRISGVESFGSSTGERVYMSTFCCLMRVPTVWKDSGQRRKASIQINCVNTKLNSLFGGNLHPNF